MIQSKVLNRNWGRTWGISPFYHPPAPPDQPGVAPLPSSRRREMLEGMASPLAKR
jgi:hypothetical protein